MSIQNKKWAIILPLVFAGLLVVGIYIGLQLSNSKISDRLLIYPKADKVNSLLNLIEDSYVDTVSRDKLEESAIASVLDHLDPHSVYIPADKVQETNEPLEGNFSGIGVSFNMQNDTIVIMNTIPNGPSERVGIKPGDRIVAVNDSIVAGKKMDSDNIVKRLKGKRGTIVKVGIKRIGYAELMNFNISRDMIPLYSIDAAYMVSPGIGYIKLNKFAKTSYDEFVSSAKALHKEGMKKLILDLRDNGGGLLDGAIKIADQFLDDKQLIVYTEGRARPRVESYSTPGGECLNDSLIILMNEMSASASEIVAGAIQDNDRGLVIGRRSFGKGLVQEPALLPGGAVVRLTIARYYTPSGRCIQKSYKNGNQKYYEEIHDRYVNGEFEQADSFKLVDTVKYTTPKGHVVYGGGGIKPDIFVPMDTSYYSDYYFRIRERTLVYDFAFLFSDAHRKDLNRIKTWDAMQEYLEKANVLASFVSYAAKKGIKPDNAGLKISGKYIQLQLEAFIIRNFFDNAGFYPLLNAADHAVLKAVSVLSAQKQ
jgi:carboxyl-terminal processing protease